jgi:DNA-binding NarL/FixJ family response regulator
MTTLQPTQSWVLIVDDDDDVRDVLSEWLNMSGYQVQTAADGMKAIALAKQQRFDLVISDLNMPGMNGHQLLSMLKTLDPQVMVIMLTGQGTMHDAIAALREGRAFDFLEKPLKDLQYLNTVIERALTRRSARPAPAALKLSASNVEALSPRETEIMTLVAQGLENREIASRLYLSEKTIQNHLTRIYEKLKVSNRTQAVSVCNSLGLL